MNIDSLENGNLKPTDFTADQLATNGISAMIASNNKQSQNLKIVLVVAMVAVVLLMVPGTLQSFSWIGLMVTLVVIIVLVVASLAITNYDTKRRVQTLSYQLSLLGFARDNNLLLRQQTGMWLSGDDLPLSFGQGSNAKFTDMLIGSGDNLIIGHYSYDIRSSDDLDAKNYTTIHDEFAMFRLGRQLPRLCVASNDVYRKNQSLVRVQLEGNFNQRFYVYTTPGAERTAFEVLTPDVMASMLDNGSNYNIEITADRLYVIKENLRVTSGVQLAEFIRHALIIAGQVNEQVNGRGTGGFGVGVTSSSAPNGSMGEQQL